MAKKPAPKDWHKEDIKAELHKIGLSLKGLALSNGYRSVDAVNQALFRPYPKAERIIAKALNKEAKEIWPSRYGHAFPGSTKQNRKFNGSAKQDNVNFNGGK